MNKLNQDARGSPGTGGSPALAAADTRRELGAAQGFTIATASMTTDLAETRTIHTREAAGRGLRNNDQEQTSRACAVVKFSPDGTRALYVHMPPRRSTRAREESSARNNMQCACACSTSASTPTGCASRSTVRPRARPVRPSLPTTTVTSIATANHPIAVPRSTAARDLRRVQLPAEQRNDTKRYIQCFDRAGATVLEQGKTEAISRETTTTARWTRTRVDGDVVSTPAARPAVAWRGCNGNGHDDGWRASTVDCTAAGTTCKFTTSSTSRSAPARSAPTAPAPSAVPTPTSRSAPGPRVTTSRSATARGWPPSTYQPRPDRRGTSSRHPLEEADRSAGRATAAARPTRCAACTCRVLPRQPAASDRPVQPIICPRPISAATTTTTRRAAPPTYICGVMEVDPRRLSPYTLPITNIQPLLLGLDDTHLGMGAPLRQGRRVVPGFTFVMGCTPAAASARSSVPSAFDSGRAGRCNLGQYDLARTTATSTRTTSATTRATPAGTSRAATW